MEVREGESARAPRRPRRQALDESVIHACCSPSENDQCWGMDLLLDTCRAVVAHLAPRRARCGPDMREDLARGVLVDVLEFLRSSSETDPGIITRWICRFAGQRLYRIRQDTIRFRDGLDPSGHVAGGQNVPDMVSNRVECVVVLEVILDAQAMVTGGKATGKIWARSRRDRKDLVRLRQALRRACSERVRKARQRGASEEILVLKGMTRILERRACPHGVLTELLDAARECWEARLGGEGDERAG